MEARREGLKLEGEGGEVDVIALSKVEFRHLERTQMAVMLETFTGMIVYWSRRQYASADGGGPDNPWARRLKARKNRSHTDG